MLNNEEKSEGKFNLAKLVELVRFGGEYSNKTEEKHYQKTQQKDILHHTRVVMTIGTLVFSLFVFLQWFNAPLNTDHTHILVTGLPLIILSVFIILAISMSALQSAIPFGIFILALTTSIANDYLLLRGEAPWDRYMVMILGQIFYFAVFIPNRYLYSLTSVAILTLSYAYTGYKLGNDIFMHEAFLITVSVAFASLVYKYQLNIRIRAYHEQETKLAQEVQDIGFSKDLIETSASENINLMEQLAIAEGEAKQNSLFLKAVLDHINQGIAVYDKNFKIVAWNEPLERLLDYPKGFLKVGLNQEDILRFNVERGEYGEVDSDEFLKTKLKAIYDSRERGDFIFDRERPNGTILNVIGATLPDGSTISSYNDVTKQRQKAEETRLLSMRDALTELANRRAFEADIKSAIRHSERTETETVLAMVDLDNFKPINDTYGHPVGDDVLKQVAKILHSNIRGSDMAARIGGDEFTIVFRDVIDPKPVYERVLAIIKAISNITVDGCEGFVLGASVGIAHYPRHGTSLAEIFKNSDLALYAAKDAGKNTVMVCQNDKDDQNNLIFRDIKSEYQA